jgi:hypothetical protein
MCNIRQEMLARMVNAIHSKDVERYENFIKKAADMIAANGNKINSPPVGKGKKLHQLREMGYDFWYCSIQRLPDSIFMDLYDTWMWYHTRQR